MDLRPGVSTYDLDWNYDEPLSVHVIDTGEGTVLFGGASEECADDLVAIAVDHGIDAVIVEHGDGDHYGAVPALREAIPDLEVAVPAGDAGFLDEAGVPYTRGLEGGETYLGVKAIAVPGHTPDNMAYLVDDVLVAGDTVGGVDSMFAAEGDWDGPLTVLGEAANADDAGARASVSRLLDHEFDVVLVTHGSNVLEDGRAAIETLVAELA